VKSNEEREGRRKGGREGRGREEGREGGGREEGREEGR